MLQEPECWVVSGVSAAADFAFVDPLLVSKSVPRERVEQFASAVGGVVADGAA
jgi:hypothetical protein